MKSFILNVAAGVVASIIVDAFFPGAGEAVRSLIKS